MQIILDSDMLIGNDILRIKNKPENLRYYLILSEGEQSKWLNNSLIKQLSWNSVYFSLPHSHSPAAVWRKKEKKQNKTKKKK